MACYTSMTAALVGNPRVTPVSPEQIVIKRIINILDQYRDDRTWSELAREIGISRPMLRMMDLNSTPPGVDTLAALLTWKPGIFTDPILQYLVSRGNTLRERTANSN